MVIAADGGRGPAPSPGAMAAADETAGIVRQANHLVGPWCDRLTAVASSVTAQTEPKFVIKPVAEKKLAQLPTGPLYWRVEISLRSHRHR